MNLRDDCMKFLYSWVTQGKLSNIRKGQVEELEAFILSKLSEAEIKRAAAAMDAQRLASNQPGESSDA